MTRLIRAVALGFLWLSIPAAVVAEELEESAFLEARKTARQLMDEPGRRIAKLRVIETLGLDDSRRACEVLVRWAQRSLKLQQGKLTKALAEAKKDFDRIDKQMRRCYEKMPPTRVKDKNAWDRLRKIHEAALVRWNAENAVRAGLGEAFRHVRNDDAVTYLIEDGLPTLQKVKRSEKAQVAVVRGILQQPKDTILPTVLALAADAERPKLRILALNGSASTRSQRASTR